MAEDKFYKCPACQSDMKCEGKYETIYVYQCTNRKCLRKWNKDAVEAKEHEKDKSKK